MIISHRHRFVFTAIPKTGTHSVRQALREHLGPDDLEQVRLFVEKRLPWPELARLGHGHISLAELRPVLGEEMFGGYFKFAFVRNPFERFVSYCAFATSQQGTFDHDPQGVMRHFLFVAPPHHHIVFRPQHSFVCAPDGTLLADQLGRVEEMQAGYDAIGERIGIPSAPLGRANSSKHADYRSYYDQQLKDGVARLYARDLELFGYEF
ncbi:sulfotransferase family protein [Sphingomonas sp. BT-65]|uniref:sulfotransferase family protein n=1 Tax=Sphingomonas sp. BT-65 TaxID=2989821 RepID=UPI0022366CAF|nr:sulfotransferase family protein [Sphingomonas sp. BT-65]MCW4461709.1 sulfotransferase family protein [Sphingomonas sp. BT-65]